MKKFTNQDVIHYYDHTEVHYRMFWKMKQSMGLHYGVWDAGVKNTPEAILNTNRQLILMGGITDKDTVLDAGCGVGGSSVYVAKHSGADVTGITLSARQVTTATAFATSSGLQQRVRFLERDYTNTGFGDHSFTVAWAIESVQTANDKSLFFKEMYRLLKPGGRIVMADMFKPYAYDISTEKDMQITLNGWAISDMLTVQEMEKIAGEQGFRLAKDRDVTREVKRSVNIIYLSGLLGKVGTRLYNLYRKATWFSRIHYKTGIHQYKAYKKKLWQYHLLVWEKA
jgi:tocopherol O-methyltransferase